MKRCCNVPDAATAGACYVSCLCNCLLLPAPVNANACYCLPPLLPAPATFPAPLTSCNWTLQLLPLGTRNAPANLLDAATAASGATQRCCNASGRCNCCFWGHAALLQRSWTLQLLLLGPRNAPPALPEAVAAASGLGTRNAPATLPQRSRNAPATLPDAATAL